MDKKLKIFILFLAGACLSLAVLLTVLKHEVNQSWLESAKVPCILMLSLGSVLYFMPISGQENGILIHFYKDCLVDSDGKMIKNFEDHTWLWYTEWLKLKDNNHLKSYKEQYFRAEDNIIVIDNSSETPRVLKFYFQIDCHINGELEDIKRLEESNQDPAAIYIASPLYDISDAIEELNKHEAGLKKVIEIKIFNNPCNPFQQKMFKDLVLGYLTPRLSETIITVDNAEFTGTEFLWYHPVKI